MSLLMLGTQIHGPEQILHKPGASEVEMANAKPHRLKSLLTDHTQAELFKTEGRTICSETQNIIIFIWNQEEWLSTERSRTFYVYMKGEKRNCGRRCC